MFQGHIATHFRMSRVTESKRRPLQVCWCKLRDDGLFIADSSAGDLGQVDPDVNHFVLIVVEHCYQVKYNTSSKRVREYYTGCYVEETVRNGDCGLDCMVMQRGEARSAVESHKLRLELKNHIMAVATQLEWQAAFTRAGEGPNVMPKASGAAVRAYAWRGRPLRDVIRAKWLPKNPAKIVDASTSTSNAAQPPHLVAAAPVVPTVCVDHHANDAARAAKAVVSYAASDAAITTSTITSGEDLPGNGFDLANLESFSTTAATA